MAPLAPLAPRLLTRQQMADLARSLAAALDAIRNDELSASTTVTYRLEGAVTALETVLDRTSE